ncbi:MAG TPA: hypothetical protein PK639_03580 [Candidatus Woesebacteria bacterium]|nr:hypothetical protein [Candidatus Woesebacteria bacterium]
MEGIKGSQKMQELHQEEKDIAKRRVGLALLCLASMPPGLLNDFLKTDKAEKILTGLTKDGKKGEGVFKFLPDLYPDVPEWLMVATGTLDAADPKSVLGLVAEIYQWTADALINQPINIFEKSKEIIRVAVENIEKVRANQPQINQAKAAFAA